MDASVPQGDGHRQSLQRSNNQPVEMNNAVGLGPHADPAGRTIRAVGRGPDDLVVIGDSKLVPVGKQRKAVPFSWDDIDVCVCELLEFFIYEAMKAGIV